MNQRMKRGRVLIWILCVLTIIAVSGIAVQHSVAIRASWKILPYQTLRLSGSGEEVASIAFNLPDPTPQDHVRGYIETEHAVRLHVVSNTPWKIQVRALDPRIDGLADVQLRSRGREYLTLSSRPQIIAQGLNGVFEVSIDYRLLLGDDGDFASGAPLEIIYTIMSD